MCFNSEPFIRAKSPRIYETRIFLLRDSRFVIMNWESITNRMKATLEIQLSDMLTAAELADLSRRAAAERRPVEALIAEAIRNLLGRPAPGPAPVRELAAA